MAGFPGGGPFRLVAARVRDTINARGPDIYHETVTREVYTIRSKVRSGNSGGPLVDSSGRVLGVIFAAAVDDPNTGYALTAQEVASDAAAAENSVTPVSTGRCA